MTTLPFGLEWSDLGGALGSEPRSVIVRRGVQGALTGGGNTAVVAVLAHELPAVVRRLEADLDELR
ncbi:hypothetical protein ACSDQ9_07370 [Aestuariimicrobium soli]|uniref:hypothetical protein n=1 Tax=Aestuariimicrobium soli TaxID=2035834 RepID=UPI003EB9ED2A